MSNASVWGSTGSGKIQTVMVKCLYHLWVEGVLDGDTGPVFRPITFPFHKVVDATSQVFGIKDGPYGVGRFPSASNGGGALRFETGG